MQVAQLKGHHNHYKHHCHHQPEENNDAELKPEDNNDAEPEPEPAPEPKDNNNFVDILTNFNCESIKINMKILRHLKGNCEHLKQGFSFL